MPINLKATLMRNGISQGAWGKSVTQTNGFPLSLPGGNQLLNWGSWPKATPRESIIQQTEDYLRARGVPEAEIALIWDTDSKDEMRGAHPLGIHETQLSPRPAQDFEADLIGEPQMLSPEAKKHFSMFRSPFMDDVNKPEDVYRSPDIRYVSESLYSTAKHGGIMAVIGESGGGKSVLRKDLLDRIERDREQIHVIFPRVIDKSRLTAGTICEAIIKDIQPDAKLPQSLEAKARMVEKVLKGSADTGNKHVIIIEEAHDLTIQCMKYLKRFWEIEDGFKKLLAIIMIGQPELSYKLNEGNYPEAREFIRRCEVAQLVPLDANLEKYIAFKFERVGTDAATIIEPDTYQAIRDRLTKRTQQKSISHMNPLMVNNLLTKAMNLAAEIGEAKISAEVIKQI
ncbi:MAG: ExeA family protein [Methylophilaceae bacterium]